jgi:hypothetical protein
VDELVNVSHTPVTEYVEGVRMLALSKLGSGERPQH